MASKPERVGSVASAGYNEEGGSANAELFASTDPFKSRQQPHHNPERLKMLREAFERGDSLRAAAKFAKCSVNTAAKYRRDWYPPVDIEGRLRVWIERQRALADLWERQRAGDVGDPPHRGEKTIRNWVNWLRHQAREIESILEAKHV